ncbi:MAG: 50S ribosomal protein L6 [Victivallaceae bacterium]
MSRIGKKPVPVPAGVKVSVNGGTISVEGKEKLTISIPPKVSVEVQDSNVLVTRNDESRESSAMQGLARSLINNMVIGVTAGFRKDLQIIGVGYKAQINGSNLVLNLGYSHTIEYQVPKTVKVSVVDNTKITIEGADKHLVGETAATIRRFRQPEPYKGKGIRYSDEKITLKEGKSVS